MGKRELKKQYKELDINVIDFITRFDPTPSNKLTPFLLRELAKSTIWKSGVKRGRDWHTKITNPINELEFLISSILSDYLGGRDNIESLTKFSEHLEAGRVQEKDISKYRSWDAINWAIHEAEIKQMDKELSKQIEIIHSDDTWLFLKPLSFKAAQTYGSGTKWCTSMRNDPAYFYRYCKQGILIYTINKVTGKKFGFYSSPEEFSVWDSKDKRVDSMESRIPNELLVIIRESLELDVNKTNHEMFSEEELIERERLLGGGLSKLAFNSQPIEGAEQDTDMDGGPYMDEEAISREYGGILTNDEANEDGLIQYSLDLVEEGQHPFIEETITQENGGEDSWEPRGADVAYGNVLAGEAEMVEEDWRDVVASSENWDERD